MLSDGTATCGSEFTALQPFQAAQVTDVLPLVLPTYPISHAFTFLR